MFFRQRHAAGLAGLASVACALGPPSYLGDQLGARRIQSRAADSPVYEAHTLSVPVDHFHNETRYEPHSNATFPLRYWYDDRFYEPGGPIFVLAAGETSGEDRFPILQKGIVYQVTKATKGLGVILEHRYYGESQPVGEAETNKDLRFLSTEQALADSAYFAEHVKFDGIPDVSPESTPWIVYGGSYAGAFAAFLRVQYPDVYMGAISSSGVPAAIWNYWQYSEALRTAVSEECTDTIGKIVNTVDKVIADHPNQLKSLQAHFRMETIPVVGDFAASVSGTFVNSLQSYQWDPSQSDDYLFRICDATVQDKNRFPDLEEKRPEVERFIELTGWEKEMDPLADRWLNYLGTILDTKFVSCGADDYDACYPNGSNSTQLHSRVDQVASSSAASLHHRRDVFDDYRSWTWQVCNEFGFLATGDVPDENILPLTARACDVKYRASQSCVNFDFPADHVADTDRINKYGGHNISYPNLAFIDGEWDPWRGAGVHAIGLPHRESTPSEPRYLIPKAVHHWDENGLLPNETTAQLPPKSVKDAHEFIKEFVKGWLDEWERGRL